MTEGKAPWSARERSAIEPMLRKIDAAPGRGEAYPKTAAVSVDDLVRCRCESPHLTHGSCLIRLILSRLGVDERRVFRWHVDNKLFLALVLVNYLGDRVPVTRGLASSLAEAGGDENLPRLFPGGYVIKDVRGFASDRAMVLASGLAPGVQVAPAHEPVGKYGGLLAEEKLVQDKLACQREYRVHTLGTRLIPNLTYRNTSARDLLTGLEKRMVHAFVQRCVDDLPPALLEDSLCGWDICGEGGRYRIIEVNFSGVHPVFVPGFHCSGAFQIEAVAAQNIARLLHFLEHTAGTDIHLDGGTAGVDAAAGADATDFVSLVERIGRWRRLLRAAEVIRAAWSLCQSEKDAAGRTLRERLMDGSAKFSDVVYLSHLDALRRLTRDLAE